MQKSASPERIPREALHDQHERLTTKHIQTLSFLQDIANENKQLKARVEQLELIQKEYETLQEMADHSQERIKQIQEQYMQRADEINAMLAEKHKTEILQLVDEKIEIEKNAHEEITKLKSQIESLQQTNQELLNHVGTSHQLEEDNKTLLQEREMAWKEIDQLKLECTKLRKDTENKADMHHVQGLKAQNEALNQQVKELGQKRDELEYRISRLEVELQEKSQDADKVTLIENLKNKLEKLHKEKMDHLQKISRQDNEIVILKLENEQLKGSLIKLEKEKEVIALEFKRVFYELQTLRKQLSRDQEKRTFKDFVMVKRELNVLKDENEFLRQKNKITVESLPFLKADRPSSGTKGVGVKDSGKKRQLALTSPSKSDI